MFTGIVERTGRVVSLTASPSGSGTMPAITQLIIDADRGFDTRLGDSVAVNGCCLTVTSNKVQMLAFDVSSETLERTALATLQEGDEVNLERAMRLGDRLGGHMVSGHIDGRARVPRIRKQAAGWEVYVELPPELGRYVVAKGSICIDGVSLTVNTVADRGHDVLIMLMLIPTTVSLTSLKHLQEGQIVNVEVDLIGKYVERLVGPWSGAKS